ncbi:MAG: IS1 family transposase [Pirellulaceae bacterium]|nr:IS1 family transposase [Pirellulaceae bacterium]
MRIGTDKASAIIRCLAEGCGVRGTARLTDVSKREVCRLMLLVGERCRRFMEDSIVNVPVADVQADELWSFVYCKEKTRKRLSLPLATYGDMYCFVGMERHNKLALAWHLGNRELESGRQFVAKLAHACWKKNFQITTDGWRNYKPLIGAHFAGCDFGMLIKIFNAAGDTTRYSPGTIIEFKKKSVQGTPDEDRMCTSHVERGNLTIRMGMRRFTRLTNGFSKKFENHQAALGLHFALYNYVTPHGTLRTTPAVAAGLTDKKWSVADLIERTRDYSPPPVQKNFLDFLGDAE